MQTFGSQETMSEIAKWQPLEQTQPKLRFVWFTQCLKEFVSVCFANQWEERKRDLRAVTTKHDVQTLFSPMVTPTFI